MYEVLTNMMNHPLTLTLVLVNHNHDVEEIEIEKITTNYSGLSNLEATLVANKIGPIRGKLNSRDILNNSFVFDIEAVETEDKEWQSITVGIYDGKNYYVTYSSNVEELARGILEIWPFGKIFAAGYNISSYDFAMLNKTLQTIIKPNSIIKSRVPKFFSKEYGEEIYGQGSIDLMNLSLLTPLPSHSLDIVLECLNTPIKKYDQKMFLEMLYNQNWDLIIEHNKNDNYGTYEYLKIVSPLIHFILENSLGSVSYALNSYKIARNMLVNSLFDYTDNPLKRIEIVYKALKKHNLLNGFNKQELKYSKKGKSGAYKESYILFKHLQLAEHIQYSNKLKNWAAYYLLEKIENFANKMREKIERNPKYIHILAILNSIVSQITKPLYLKDENWRYIYNKNFSDKIRRNTIYDDFYIAVLPKKTFHKYSLSLDNFVCGKTQTDNVYYEASYKGIVLASKTSLPQKILLPDHYYKELNKARINRARGLIFQEAPKIEKNRYNLSIRTNYKTHTNYTNQNSSQAIMSKKIYEEAKKYGLKLRENEPLIIWLGDGGEPLLFYDEDKIDLDVYRNNVFEAYKYYNLYRKNTLDNFLS